MNQPLLDKLKAATTQPVTTKPRVREVRLRLPPAAVDEIKLLASAHRLSMNALVAAFIDAGLVAHGRKSLAELDPSFLDYLQGSSEGNALRGDVEDFT
ncbi:hypothetical protein [Devosia sp.]|uniref:hypothetical protein n=1 Tax=Devosia sp. TaxID=1871048 RepID=UPI002FCA55C3